jgi:hypothetical protein
MIAVCPRCNRMHDLNPLMGGCPVTPGVNAPRIMSEGFKPANCTCQYPVIRAKCGSGHATSCPVQREWERDVKKP